MTLKTIQLTFAERNLLEFFFGTMSSVKPETALMVKSIRKAFDTKPVAKALDKFNSKSAAAGLAPLQWSDVIDTSDYAEMLAESTSEVKASSSPTEAPEAAAAREKRIERLNKLAERLGKIDTAARDYTIDSMYLAWLRDEALGKYDLAKRVVPDRQGGTKQIDLPASVDQIEVFADLLEKVKAAAAA